MGIFWVVVCAKCGMGYNISRLKECPRCKSKDLETPDLDPTFQLKTPLKTKRTRETPALLAKWRKALP